MSTRLMRAQYGPTQWAILTGEYPPQPGGVSDYTRVIATALAAAGDDVMVFAPPCNGRELSLQDGITVRRLPDRFGSRGLAVLERALSGEHAGRRILLQYVPHAFGNRAMNVRLCQWLFSRRGRSEIWTMFHEVSYPWALRQPPQHNLLATVNRAMALLLARASRRIFVSTTAWRRTLRPLLGPRSRAESLPIPSNIAVEADPIAVRRIRATVGDCVVGHFGTFGPQVAPLLRSLIPPILQAVPRARALLIGRGASAFVVAFEPALRERMAAAENLSAQEAADHLSACDLLVQPFPDGATTRRSSLMGPIALGLPIATTEGELTEPLWRETGAVALAPAVDTQALAALAAELLRDPGRRAALAAAGQSLYRDRFALRHTIDLLRGTRGGDA